MARRSRNSRAERRSAVRPGTIPDEPLEAFAVGGLDADAPIEAKPAGVIPGDHVGGLVGFQEAVAAKMSQDPGTDGMLEALQELAGESCGFVEGEDRPLLARRDRFPRKASKPHRGTVGLF